jgi:hypothetical protein
MLRPGSELHQTDARNWHLVPQRGVTLAYQSEAECLYQFQRIPTAKQAV